MATQENGPHQLQNIINKLNAYSTEEKIWQYYRRLETRKDNVRHFDICIRDSNTCHSFTIYLDFSNHWAIRQRGRGYREMSKDREQVTKEAVPDPVWDIVSVLKPLDTTSVGGTSNRSYLFVPIGTIHDGKSQTSFGLGRLLDEERLAVVYDYGSDEIMDDATTTAIEACESSRKALLPGTLRAFSIALLSGELQIEAEPLALHSNHHQLEIVSSGGFKVEDAGRLNGVIKAL